MKLLKRITFIPRIFSWRHAVVVRGVKVGAAADEKFDHSGLATIESAAQWSMAFDVACFQIGAGSDKKRADIHVVRPRGHVQRRAFGRPAMNVHLSLVGEQYADNSVAGRSGICRKIDRGVSMAVGNVRVNSSFEEKLNVLKICITRGPTSAVQKARSDGRILFQPLADFGGR